MQGKSTVDEIRARFDTHVERFSNLETGQSATIDAPLAMELVAECAAATTPGAKSLLDIGCGAGNYTLKLLSRLPGLDVTLIDLSRPMLDRAVERISAAPSGAIRALQQDVRESDLGAETHDIALAAAVMHHLRSDAEWESVFAKIFAALRPGGSFWIFDLIRFNTPVVQAIQWRRYGEYLTGLRDETYRDQVFEYVEQEDTPRSLTYQVDLLKRTGFAEIEILHCNGPFAAFGGIKR